ncbi:hypothetical protein [Streptomyces sp. KMM 9044]|uniref:hypothetical protein n=1 Tax=Streptomyces sp. KMM 9044 TaxID=2744474 RepID=UPI002151BBAF|nr:hypothetical protein [Streptomyces sp. KMM 9044]WAX79187.1 hypothetical protein HUV60_017415 [Streptomyces sp. KMM 9044]
MTGGIWRERGRALLRDDPAGAKRAARLLDELGTGDREDDEEIEAGHHASCWRRHRSTPRTSGSTRSRGSG